MPLGADGAGDPLLGGSLLGPEPLEARMRIKQVSYGILQSFASYDNVGGSGGRREAAIAMG